MYLYMEKSVLIYTIFNINITYIVFKHIEIIKNEQ